MRLKVCFVAFILGCATGGPKVPPPTESNQIAFVTTANLGAEMEPCGCRDNPVGGFERKANFLNSQKGNQTIQVDTGDLFFESNRVHPDLRQQLVYKARQVVEGYNLMGHDVVTLGDRDLAAGVGTLLELGHLAQFKIVTTNLKAKSTGEFLFSPHVLVNRGALRIGFLGVTSDTIVNEFYSDEVVAEPMAVAIKRELEKLKGRADLIVVLAHLDLRETQALAKQVPEVRLWFTADQGGSDQPEISGRQLFVVPQVQGQKLSHLIFTPRANVESWANLSAQPRIQNQIDLLKGDISEIEEAVDVQSNEHAMERIREKRRQIEVYERQLVRGRAHEIAFQHSMIEMDPTYDGKNALSVIVDLYKESVKKQSFPTKPVMGYSKAFAMPKDYQPKGLVQKGAKGVSTFHRCRTCHEKQWDFWASTSHFSAMNSLYSKNQHLNRECLACHTIGFNEPEGWVHPNQLIRDVSWDPDSFFQKVFVGDGQAPLKRKNDRDRWSRLHANYTKELMALAPWNHSEAKVFMGVQCEHCHGRRLDHPSDQKSYPKKVQQDSCLNCHRPDHSDGFAFEKWLPMVACPQ